MAVEIRTRPFRVTYATARLPTLDGGAPVSPWTVEKELGHGSRAMLEEVYGRLGDVRHRSEAVDYRSSSISIAFSRSNRSSFELR
ncbi:MAG: hypothetical protein ACREOQ_13115 [Gemmatimonadales bacterium]